MQRVSHIISHGLLTKCRRALGAAARLSIESRAFARSFSTRARLRSPHQGAICEVRLCLDAEVSFAHAENPLVRLVVKRFLYIILNI